VGAATFVSPGPSGNARQLVDSRDFERAMEKASSRDLKALFDEAVYR
jgi:hypothetical protein